MMKNLEGKVIVIIGGTSGIGASAARAVASEGALLTVTGRSLDKINNLRTGFSEKIDIVACDAQNSFETNKLIENVVNKYGRLDGLFHVAGGSGRSMGDGVLHEISDDAWKKTLQLNLDTVFYSNRAAIKQFLKQGSGGSIINMSSVLGISPSSQYFSAHAYATAKSAIIGFSKSLASCYANKNIRVNVIAPGLVSTPMAGRAKSDQKILDFIKTKQPLGGGRIGEPEDYNDAVLYLLSEGSKFMTGQVLTIDGGWTCSDGQYNS